MRKSTRTGSRRFFAGFLIVTLLVAGVVSYYASSHPDGLEYVAGETGFLDSAEEHPLGEGPMADYQTEGVGNPRLSGGLAGVTGVLLVLVITGGIAYAVRRRGPTEAHPSTED